MSAMTPGACQRRGVSYCPGSVTVLAPENVLVLQEVPMAVGIHVECAGDWLTPRYRAPGRPHRDRRAQRRRKGKTPKH